jgi:hypothetical protein
MVAPYVFEHASRLCLLIQIAMMISAIFRANITHGNPYLAATRDLTGSLSNSYRRAARIVPADRPWEYHSAVTSSYTRFDIRGNRLHSR